MAPHHDLGRVDAQEGELTGYRLRSSSAEFVRELSCLGSVHMGVNQDAC